MGTIIDSQSTTNAICLEESSYLPTLITRILIKLSCISALPSLFITISVVLFLSPLSTFSISSLSSIFM